jgi:hypothetical protein
MFILLTNSQIVLEGLDHLGAERTSSNNSFFFIKHKSRTIDLLDIQQAASREKEGEEIH